MPARKGFLVVVLSLLSALSGLAGCSAEPVPDDGGPAPLASSTLPGQEVEGVGTAAEPEQGRWIGVVVARQAVDLGAEVDGTLAEVAVRVGDAVLTGQPLARLETQELTQDLARAQASRQAAAADVRRAEVELRRAEEQLRRRRTMPDLFAQEELESSHSERDMAVADVESARARVAEQAAYVLQLENRLQRSVLRAPIDGRIAARFLDPGAQVHPGTPVLRLIASDDFVLRFAVPPQVVSHLQAGDRVEASLEGMDLTLRGTVSQIAPQVDAASQLVFVEAELEPAASGVKLQDGLVARIRKPRS